MRRLKTTLITKHQASNLWANSHPLHVFVNEFYWNTAMLTCLHIENDRFHATMAELSNLSEDYMAGKPKIFTIYSKSSPTPDLKDHWKQILQ